jgi:hypothetical protein
MISGTHAPLRAPLEPLETSLASGEFNLLCGPESLSVELVRLIEISEIRFPGKLKIEVASAQFLKYTRVADVGTGADVRP